MRTINFQNAGGFPLKQYTLNKMQESYFEMVFAVLEFFGINTTAGNFILKGCEVVGANITPGWLFMDGHLMYYDGGAGDANTKLLKQVGVESAVFKNLQNNPVYYTSSVVQNVAGTALSAFTRINQIPVIDPNTVIDANYVHTDNNLTDGLLVHINSIAFGAEVNVQADWNVTNANSDAFIKNKPNIFPYIYRGETLLGLVQWSASGWSSYTINFPDINTTDYLVQAYWFDANGNRYQWPYKLINVQDDQFTIIFYPATTQGTTVTVLQNVSIIYYIFPKL